MGMMEHSNMREAPCGKWKSRHHTRFQNQMHMHRPADQHTSLRSPAERSYFDRPMPEQTELGTRNPADSLHLVDEGPRYCAPTMLTENRRRSKAQGEAFPKQP